MFRIDHLIVGGADLARAVESFRERTGVQAVIGGEHPSMGTHNALASLGEDVYIEVIAPRPNAEPQGRWRVLAGIEGLAPAGWAVRAADLGRAREVLREAGFRTSQPMPGARVQPNGVKLEWVTADILGPDMPLAPFLIQWAESSPHPSTTAPPGCGLTSVTLLDPDPAPLAKLVEAMGLAVKVRESSRRSLAFELACPRGAAVFGVD
jgi:hypothetical protein